MNKDELKILEMLKLQDKLNVKTCGKNWREGHCKKTMKHIYWDLCILDECSELLNSFNWKHWKEGEDNYKNAELELIDILHFLLSKLLSTYNNNAKFLATLMYSSYLYANDLFNNKYGRDKFKLIEKLSKEKNIIPQLDTFFLLGISAFGFTIDKLYNKYIVKNLLNEQRVKLGYQTGEYVKEFKPSFSDKVMEDNEIVFYFIDKGLDPAKAIAKFKQEYKKKDK